MRISDWSSDVCSSDLIAIDDQLAEPGRAGDVGALADIDEDRAVETAAGGAGKVVLLGHAAGTAKGSRPLSRSCGGMTGTLRGFTPFTLSAIDRKSTRLNSSH